VSPGPGQPSAASPSRIKGLVRRATPYSIAGLVALYGVAAAALSLTGRSGLIAALALLVGLVALVGAVVAVANRDARSSAATVERTSKALRDSEAWLRAALDHADVGMGIIDAGGDWLHVNSRPSICLLYTSTLPTASRSPCHFR
jgi:PAS domain-containing protein